MSKIFWTITLLFAIFSFSGCSSKSLPLKTTDNIILFKTKKLRFYDTGFIQYHKDFTKIEIFQASIPVLSLKLYEDRVCQSTFRCILNEAFNDEFLDSSYPSRFLKDFFDGKKIDILNTTYKKEVNRVYFKDKAHNIKLMYKVINAN
jgi:hypothetical protein